MALSIEAASAAGSFLLLSKTRISGSVWTPGKRLSASETAWEPGAGHLEATGGQMLRLLRGEWHGSHDEHDPYAQNESPAPRDESLEPVHGCPHGRK